MNGARSDQSNITLDGTDVNDQVNGYAFDSVLPVTLDSVQEFRVTTTNYGADEGRSSGAQIALVTKSGTNTFHGSAYEYLRNTYTSANDYFIKQAQLSSNQPNVAPKLNYNIFGVSAGGPILKDRLFFFVNYEGERLVQDVSAVRIVPSDALRAGYLTYLCADQTDPRCGVTPAGDPTQAQPGYYALTSAQIQAMDPLHIGLNSVIRLKPPSTLGRPLFPGSRGLVVASGLIYGVAVYAFMNYFVLPLSAYHAKIALPSVKDVAILMFLVGLPISLVVRRYSDLGPA